MDIICVRFVVARGSAFFMVFVDTSFRKCFLRGLITDIGSRKKFGSVSFVVLLLTLVLGRSVLIKMSKSSYESMPHLRGVLRCL